VNGQHPAPPNVTTAGPYNLTISISPTTYTGALDAYWVFAVNGSVTWVTPAGLSTTPAPLFHSVPFVMTDVPLLSTTLPHGTTVTTGFFLVNGSTTVSQDVITAQVP